MSNRKTIDEIKKAYENKEYETRMEYPKQGKYSKNHVFDRNQTVIWNEEEVVRKNKEIDEDKKKYRDDCKRLEAKLQDDIVQAVYDNCTLNMEQVKKIYGYVYREYHSCFSDVFIYMSEIIDMVEEVIEIGNKARKVEDNDE